MWTLERHHSHKWLIIIQADDRKRWYLAEPSPLWYHGVTLSLGFAGPSKPPEINWSSKAEHSHHKKLRSKAILSQKEWKHAQANRPIIASSPITQPKITYSDNTIFCNTDATWRTYHKAAGLSWIFTDQNSQELHRASTPQANVSSACMAEALAIREALIQTSSLQFTNICRARQSNHHEKTIDETLQNFIEHRLAGVLPFLPFPFVFLHLHSTGSQWPIGPIS